MTGKTHKSIWKGIHKWVGAVMALLLSVFCLSGIILNHRGAVARFSVSRALLPSSYQIRNYNNGVFKGTLPFADGRVMAYGNSGVWLTDRSLTTVTEFNKGLPEGADGRNIRNIVRTRDGRYWCAAQFDVYRLEGDTWNVVELPDNTERITDIALMPDSSAVVVASRSDIYIPSADGFVRKELPAPRDYKREVTLFRTLWLLHSGELFGAAGKIAVDIIAAIIAFLSVTGVILFVLHYSLKHGGDRDIRRKSSMLKRNFRLHDKTGYVTLILTILIVFTGMCLRPPFMIPCVLVKTRPVAGSTLDDENAWHDRLRAVRWDESENRWLLSTSEGFFSVRRDFDGAPVRIANGVVPPVSPMGITVFERADGNEWIVGSFSGLYRWNPATGATVDHLSGTPLKAVAGGRPVSSSLVSGFSRDFGPREIIFDYAKGADGLPPMPEILEKQPMSLWNFALEMHVGRMYSSLLGPVSGMFIFLSGLLSIMVLVSGLILHNRFKNKKHNNK